MKPKVTPQPKRRLLLAALPLLGAVLFAMAIVPQQGRLGAESHAQVEQQVRSLLKAEQLNAWSSVKYTGGEDPHAYGINLDVWKHGAELVGYLSEYGGSVADAPIARVDSIRFNEQSGAFSFKVLLNAGAVYSDSTKNYVTARWLYRFTGVVGDSVITGSMLKTLLNRDSRPIISSEPIVLKSVAPSKYEPTTFEKWVEQKEMIVKFRGSGGG